VEDTSFDQRQISKTPGDKDCDGSMASKTCVKEVLSDWHNMQHSSAATIKEPKAVAHEKPEDKSQPPVERKDIATGLFDEKSTLSHFSRVADGVFRSARPNGEAGVKAEVNNIWNDSELNLDHAKHTSIVDLRGPAPAPYTESNEEEMRIERTSAESLGINYHNFPMQSKDYYNPDFVQSVIDYIDQEKAGGKQVVIHCYHGSDRSGLISAAYELSHFPRLQELLKNNPDEAYAHGMKSMEDSGFTNSAKYKELAKSLKDYVDWKHAQLSDRRAAASSAEFLEMPPLWTRAA
jgi:protein tyrosine/serine phosphatase